MKVLLYSKVLNIVNSINPRDVYMTTLFIRHSKRWSEWEWLMTNYEIYVYSLGIMVEFSALWAGETI